MWASKKQVHGLEQRLAALDQSVTEKLASINARLEHVDRRMAAIRRGLRKSRLESHQFGALEVELKSVEIDIAGAIDDAKWDAGGYDDPDAWMRDL